MGLRADLAAWDGKSADDIEHVYDRHCGEPSFVSETLDLAAEPSLQNGATWLLKHHIDVVNSLPADDIIRFYTLLPNFTHWESRLHVLQCIPHLPIPKEHREVVEAFLRVNMTDEVKYVRAWAYGGYWDLARQFPEYRDEAERLCETAIHHEAPSVKARLRQAMKKGF